MFLFFNAIALGDGKICRECSLTLPLEIKYEFFFCWNLSSDLYKKKQKHNSFVFFFQCYSPRGIAGKIDRECSLTLPLEIKNEFFFSWNLSSDLYEFVCFYFSMLKKNKMNSFVFFFQCYSPRGIAGKIYRECSRTLSLQIQNEFFLLRCKLRPLKHKQNEFVCFYFPML